MNNFFLLFLSCFSLLSCASPDKSGQESAGVEQEAGAVALGDTVGELGKNIMTVYEDKKGNYWFASWEDGLYKYDGQLLLHFTTEHGLPHNRVEDVQEDASGAIFFNTPGGVCRFDGTTFTTLTAIEDNDWRLQSGDLWFRSSHYEDTVYRYDGSVLHCLTMPTNDAGETWRAEHPNSPSPYGVYTIYTDSRGNLWFGSSVAGACRYNGISFDWISENDVTEFHYGPSNGVRSIIEDKDGYFWFNSAYKYDVYGNTKKPEGTFYNRIRSFGNIDRSPDSDFWEYMSIAKDWNNELWIAAYHKGVWHFDGTKVVQYPVQHMGEDITVFSIYTDNHGVLWLGTHEHGAYKFDGTAFRKFSL